MKWNNAIFERALSGDLSLSADGRFMARAAFLHRMPVSGAGAFAAFAPCSPFTKHHRQMLAPDTQ